MIKHKDLNKKYEVGDIESIESMNESELFVSEVELNMSSEMSDKEVK